MMYEFHSLKMRTTPQIFTLWCNQDLTKNEMIFAILSFFISSFLEPYKLENDLMQEGKN